MRRWPTVCLLAAVSLLIPSSALAQSIEWTDQFGSSGFDVAWGVVATDTDVYVDGWTDGVFSGQTGRGGFDGFLRRIDAAGNEVWTVQFGTRRDDFVVALGMDATGLYVTGGTFGRFHGQTALGNGDGFLRKYDFDGNAVWTRQFGTTDDDFPSNVVADPSGVYVIGSTSGAFTGESNRGSFDVFLTRFDADGNQDWTDQFGSRDDDFGYANAIGTAGIFVDGFTDGRLPGQIHIGDTDAFVGLYGTDGTQTWLTQFGTRRFDAGYGIVADDTGVSVSGVTYGGIGGLRNRGKGDAYVRRFSAADGSTVWTRLFGTRQSDASYGLAQFGTELYAVGATDGQLHGQTSAGGSDAFVRALDVTDGTTLWTTQFGTRRGDAANWAWAVTGAVYVDGDTRGRFAGEVRSGETDGFVTRVSTT